MTISFSLFFFVFGTIIGSFLNVVILRYRAWSLHGRSVCSSCGKRLSWYELIPILSFVFLRGHCSSCKSRISPQYPLVELGTGFLFMGTYLTGHVGLELLASLILISGFIVIFVYDLYHKIIPDGLIYLCVVVSFVSMFFGGSTVLSFPSVWDIVAGPVLFLPFFLLWFFSGGTWMGLGDAKLALAIGWSLGLSGGLTAIIVAFWLGAGVSLSLIAFERIVLRRGVYKEGVLTLRSEIPFAPFLIASYCLVFFFGVNIFTFTSLTL